MIAERSLLEGRLGELAGPRVGRMPQTLRMSRNDLPALCRGMEFTNGAEIGVWKGAFAAAFCEANPALHMLCVDPWASYPAWVDTKHDVRDPARQMAHAYRDALARLSSLNCTILRQFSAEAAETVPDRSLDFVYVDGNHSFAAVTEDLTLWTPKVRPGGFVADHDYRVMKQKPFIHVVEAVQAYTKAHAIDPWFVLTADRMPSFLWVVN